VAAEIQEAAKNRQTPQQREPKRYFLPLGTRKLMTRVLGSTTNCNALPKAACSIAGNSEERSKSWEDDPNAQRNTATAVGSVDRAESRVDQGSDEDFKAGRSPCFSFAGTDHFSLQIARKCAHKTLE
jgi:hypothetical protein